MSDFDVINKMLLCDYEYFKDKTITPKFVFDKDMAKIKTFHECFHENSRSLKRGWNYRNTSEN